MIHSKIWGTTEETFSNDNFEVHRICVNKGGYCSEHFHKHKHNLFYIESGKLEIDVFYEDHIVKTILKPGQKTTVEPKCKHKFIALENTVAYEIYWVNLLKEDIVRIVDGGMNKITPERIYLSDTNTNISNENKHIYRYKFASMFIEGGISLDCACGSGYGSKIIADKADYVWSIDKSNKAIDFAKKNNYSDNIQYVNKELQNLTFEKEYFDNIISLETLEHISKEDMIDFLNNVHRWLKINGCFIGSSPMLRYKDNKPNITNPYHINELPKNELLSIIESCFKKFKISYFHQNIKSFSILNDEHTGFCIFVARKVC